MKLVVNYLNFVFHVEVKTKSDYNILNFIYQKHKVTLWAFWILLELTYPIFSGSRF